MKKRLVSVLLAGLMTVGLVGCKTSTAPASTNTNTNTASEAPKKVEKYGKETIKIAFENYDPTAAQFIQMQKYFKYLQNYVNVEFIYSEAIKSAEDEMAFLESAAAAGAKAVIGYYNVAGKAAIQKAVDLGMYYYGHAENKEIYNEFKNNKLYLGSVDIGEADYTGGYAMAKGLIDSGAKKLLLASGGKAFGVPIFVERVKGIQAAIDEANKSGKDVKIVKEINGFPDEAFFSAQGEALAMDVDGVLATFNGAEIWMQPIQAAGKSGKIKISTIASIDDMYKAAFESGQMATLAAQLVEGFAVSIPMIVNAVEGNSAVIRNADGTAANWKGDNIVIKDKDTFMKYYNVEATGVWAYGGEDIQKLIKGINKDVKYTDYAKLIADQDINSINARRGVK
jgi:DNA-binding LacI/PurR family transcriptional regulator